MPKDKTPSPLESMFLHYETLESFAELDKQTERELVGCSLRLEKGVISQLDILVAEINKFGGNVSRTSLMQEFVTQCSTELMSRMGLWTKQNQMAIWDADTKKNDEEAA